TRQLVKHAVGGLWYPIAQGRVPESDTATLAFLGYDINTEYFGRAPIEASGVGLPFETGDLALHLNLAEVSSDGSRLVQRAVLDVRDDEAASLATALTANCFPRNDQLSLQVRPLGRFGYRLVAVVRDLRDR